MTRLALMMLVVGALGATAPGARAQDPSTPEGLEGFVSLDRLPVPEAFAEGAAIWGETCQNCHGGNALVGAPKITSREAWAPRLSKGLEVLTRHAIDGFMGPKFTEMPARGGNSELTDAQVAAAVAFMAWSSGGQQLALDFLQTTTTN